MPSSLAPERDESDEELPEWYVEERNRWLQKFAKDKVFTEKEIRDALEEPFNAVRNNVPRLAPHLSKRLKSGGRNLIRTAIRLNMQLKTENLHLVVI